MHNDFNLKIEVNSENSPNSEFDGFELFQGSIEDKEYLQKRQKLIKIS